MMNNTNEIERLRAAVNSLEEAIRTLIKTASVTNSLITKNSRENETISESHKAYCRKVFETPVIDIKDLTRRIGSIVRKGIDPTWLTQGEGSHVIVYGFQTRFGESAQTKSTVEFVLNNHKGDGDSATKTPLPEAANQNEGRPTVGVKEEPEFEF